MNKSFVIYDCKDCFDFWTYDSDGKCPSCNSQNITYKWDTLADFSDMKVQDAIESEPDEWEHKKTYGTTS